MYFMKTNLTIPKNQKPLIKWSAILLGLLAALAIVLVIASHSNPDDSEEVIAGGPSSDELYFKDSDLDGIADWEEILLGFDPLSADTNGDGASDGEVLSLTRSILAQSVCSNLSTGTLTKHPR